MSLAKTIIAGSIWGILSKIIDALSKFITIPMLVTYFSKYDFGLVVLVFSLNAYMRLMDMGMNTGAIRFLSMWLAENKKEKIINAAQSSFIFYGAIGILNAIIFMLLGTYGANLFSIDVQQHETFSLMMYILAFSCVFNWASYVVNQLLTSYGEIGWLNRVNIISSLLNLLAAIIAIKLKINIIQYFLLFTVTTLAPIPLNLYKLSKSNLHLHVYLRPKWNKKAFAEIQKYSLAIFAMGIFQFSADNLRPVLLTKYASEGVAVLADYRIIQTIIMLVSSLGAVFMQILLPLASKTQAIEDAKRKNDLINTGTKYLSMFLSLVIFILISIAELLIEIYVGESYLHLTTWLIIGLFTMLYMHDYVISSFVLSTGKTKFLVYTSAIGCIVSLLITALISKKLNVGAAIVGFAVFILIQLVANYFYYLPFVLGINSFNIFFKKVLPSIFIGLCALTSSKMLDNAFDDIQIYHKLLYKLLVFFASFIVLSFFLILTKDERGWIRNRTRSIFYKQYA